MTTTPTSGAAIQRYKIGYHADEWGQRSSTPSGIPDASGSWVRYADHVTALAAGQATAAPAGGVVAYLDIGAGGYLDLGSDLSNEAISRLPKGRHALIVAGTYGIDGYTPTPPAQADSVQEDAADPLQGSANWLAEAHGQFSPVVLSGCLMIGYNRAKRLHDAALAARKQGGAT